MSSTNTVLSKNNSHPRDTQIRFYDKGHKYTILHDTDSTYTSVTTWIHSHFPKFDADAIIETMMKGSRWAPGHKYWGQTLLQIKTSWSSNSSAVSEAGTNLHYEIECFMNNESIAFPYLHANLLEQYEQKESSIEWEYFIEFICDFPHLKPYRTEWMIYDEEIKIAGSVDMIYENEDGTLSIYDWKRSKEIKSNNWFNKFALTDCIRHIHDTNFWHYALQLNIYKMILEKNYGKKVKELFLVKLHPNNETKSYELISLPILEKEVTDLRDLRKQMFIK